MTLRRFAFLALLVASACRILPAPRPEPVAFYTLGFPVPEARGLGARSLVVGLGPIKLPGYLDQTSLVRRLDNEQIALIPNARWASPLPKQFERALALRLMDALGARDVVLFPWWPGQRIDVAVELTVLGFETDAAGMARLDAFWTVTRGRSNSTVGQGQAQVREAVEGEGPAAGVAALDRALARLAAAMADDVRRAPAARAGSGRDG
jgi:uncharacterized lipoprotein YmbA